MKVLTKVWECCPRDRQRLRHGTVKGADSCPPQPPGCCLQLGADARPQGRSGSTHAPGPPGRRLPPTVSAESGCGPPESGTPHGATRAWAPGILKTAAEQSRRVSSLPAWPPALGLGSSGWPQECFTMERSPSPALRPAPSTPIGSLQPRHRAPKYKNSGGFQMNFSLVRRLPPTSGPCGLDTWVTY